MIWLVAMAALPAMVNLVRSQRLRALSPSGIWGITMKAEVFTSKPIRGRHLSAAQIEVLLSGLEHKLFRSSMGWSALESIFRTDAACIFSPSTVKSLAKRRLIDANFDDPQGFGKCDLLRGVENLDGARHSDGETPKLLVWTNRQGRQALVDLGLHSPLN